MHFFFLVAILAKTSGILILEPALIIMINSQENIINVSHNLKTSPITVANSITMPVICSGETQITTGIGKLQYYDIVVKEVLCVPDLTTNLLNQLVN